MVVFQDQKQLPGDKLHVHIVQGCKNVHNWKKAMFLINHVHKYWKGHDRNVKKKKNMQKRVLIGLFPEKKPFPLGWSYEDDIQPEIQVPPPPPPR